MKTFFVHIKGNRNRRARARLYVVGYEHFIVITFDWSNKIKTTNAASMITRETIRY